MSLGRARGIFTTTISGQMDDRQTLVVLKDAPHDALTFPWPAVIGSREIAIVTGADGTHLKLTRGTPAYAHPDGTEFAHALIFHPDPEKGDQGKTGKQGDVGPPGPQGERGFQGPQGESHGVVHWKLDYNEATTYRQGDGVRASDGLLYISTVAGNFGNDPASSPEQWMKVTP